MRLTDLNSFICIKCGHQDLKINQNQINNHEGLIEGEVSCGNCASIYSVRGKIPRFDPLENYAGSFGYQWNLHQKTQLDSHTGLPISKNRLFQVSEWPEKMEGQLVLEAGAGAGRFTEILCGTRAKIFSFDYSSAVDANYSNNGHYENLTLFQADIYNIPLLKETFNKVLCLGVLQHTPDPEKAFKSLTQYVKPGGELVIDSYAKRITGLLSWKYLLRPITKRLNKQFLYKMISGAVSILLPVAIILRKVGGRIGTRVLPILEYSHLGLPYELNREWAILDTFDMYSPAHDHPQTLTTIEKWFIQAGFVNIVVKNGPNGVIGKGLKPVRPLSVTKG